MNEELRIDSVDMKDAKSRRGLNTMGLFAIITAFVSMVFADEGGAMWGLALIATCILIIWAFAEAIVHYLRFYSVIIAIFLGVLSVSINVNCAVLPKQISNEQSISSTSPVATPIIVDYDFRSTLWGYTKDEVKQAENREPVDEADTAILFGTTTVAGLNANVFYKFDSDRLVQAAYIIEIEHTNYNLYISDYEHSKEALEEVYGEPKSEGMLWSDDLFKDDEQDYGIAVAYGYLSYGATWETPTTRIYVTLKGDNLEISHTIVYEDIKFHDNIDVGGL